TSSAGSLWAQRRVNFPHSVGLAQRTSFLWYSARSAQRTSFLAVASCGLLPGPAHEFFGSRKLRLAPQDYSPWTPSSDRFLVRSYPPASRHPQPSGLVARPSRADAG